MIRMMCCQEEPVHRCLLAPTCQVCSMHVIFRGSRPRPRPMPSVKRSHASLSACLLQPAHQGAEQLRLLHGHASPAHQRQQHAQCQHAAAAGAHQADRPAQPRRDGRRAVCAARPAAARLHQGASLGPPPPPCTQTRPVAARFHEGAASQACTRACAALCELWGLGHSMLCSLPPVT